MSLRYKVLSRCIKAAGIKKIYSKPEGELLNLLQTKFRASDLPELMYKKFDIDKTETDNRAVFKISPKNIKTDNVILFIHGGGGMMCPTPLHYRFAAKLVKNTGSALYFPFYPLGPEASINESMEWLSKVYSKICKTHGARNITVIGDSAGATLSLGVCCRAEQRPKGIVLISPSTGVDKCDEKMHDMEQYDLILSVKTIELVRKHWIKNASFDGADFNSSSLDYTGFPPVHIYYGTHELFYPYIGGLISKIRDGGVEVTVTEGEGMCHDWALMGITPEGQNAFCSICDFVMQEKIS